MNIGELARMPSRRSANTCPSSCTRIRTTKRMANGQPKRSEYAPTETIIVSIVPASLSFGRSSRMSLSFVPSLASRSARPPIGAATLRSASRTPLRGWIGPSGGGGVGPHRSGARYGSLAMTEA